MLHAICSTPMGAWIERLRFSFFFHFVLFKDIENVDLLLSHKCK